MTTTAVRDLDANRWEPFVHVVRFEGQDHTDADFIAEVRDRKDGGASRANLITVISVDLEGITLVSVANEDIDFGGDIGIVNVPVSTISIRIDEDTMEAMPYGTERGDDIGLYWDMQITPDGGDKYRAMEGVFNVIAGVTGSGA